MNTICHIEYNVTDLKRSQDFFHGLFGWDFRSFVDGMVVFGIGDQHIGGLTKVEEVGAGKSPTVWFQVEDIDSMIEKTVRLGGSKAYDKQQVPTVGWTVAVKDPDGNEVGFVQFESRD